MRPRPWLAVILAGVATSGCSGDGRSTVVVEPGLSFQVEVADSPPERATGLSRRADVPDGTGMLFTYDDAAPRSFWMAETLVALDLAWIRDGRILQVVTLQPCPAGEACPTTASPGPVDAVLEVSAGGLREAAPGSAIAVSQ